MSSSFKRNQLSIQPELFQFEGVSNDAIETRDREIYALRQQIQKLKSWYKNEKAQHPISAKHKEFPEGEYTKQKIEKLLTVISEREKQMQAMQKEASQQYAAILEEWRKEKEAKMNAVNEKEALQGQLDFLKLKMIQEQEILVNLKEKIHILEANVQESNGYEEKFSEMKTLWMKLGMLFEQNPKKNFKETEKNFLLASPLVELQVSSQKEILNTELCDIQENQAVHFDKPHINKHITHV